MYCQKCGTENRDEASFCNSCGAPLNQKSDIPQSQSTPRTTMVTAKPPEKKKHGYFFWIAIFIGIVVILFIGAAIWAIYVFGAATANTHTMGVTKVTTIPTVTQTQISKVSPTFTSSKSCAILVEGKYITTKIEDEATHATSATFETIGSGKAILTINDNTGKNTYTISYYPVRQNDPCQGIYNWQGVSDKNVPASGNFGVIGRNPDEIGMFNDAWGDFDRLTFSRI